MPTEKQHMQDMLSLAVIQVSLCEANTRQANLSAEECDDLRWRLGGLRRSIDQLLFALEERRTCLLLERATHFP